IAFVPEDRKTRGLILGSSILTNVVLPSLASIARFSVLRFRREEDISRRQVHDLALHYSHLRQPAATLSGGNQQKVVLAKWLASRCDHQAGKGMNILGLLSRTKLYWGLLLIFAIGVLFSPVTSSGKNIFLSYGNLTDVLRQVSIIGLVAVGMTTVILIAGIDLSVGSVMALGSVVAGMLLTEQGWTLAASVGIPALAVTAFVATGAITRFIF